MKLAGKTDVGRVRQENQDDYRAGELPGGAVWALVCDGMGGAKGGREASQGACNVIEQVFQEQYAQCGAGQEGAFLKKALISANRYVFNKAAHEESLAGMGTTAVCALVRGGEATLCHAGDSRAYLCRGGKLTQLTHDHSYVQELVVVKAVSGKTAGEWIAEIVVLESKVLLKSSSKSIQEISVELNFANQSFFGKYFKQHTGMSPYAYKKI